MLKQAFLIIAMAAFAGSAAKAEEDAVKDVAGATTIASAEAKQLFDQGVAFIDVREDAAWNLGRIPGAVHMDVKMPVFNKDALLKEVTADKKVVFYCNGVKCPRSAVACKSALEWGYKHVYYYREGFPGWKSAGYAVE